MVGSSGELVRAQIKSARHYAAPDVSLRDIDLSIMPGEFVVITGPAASGKSTLCYCLTGGYRTRSAPISRATSSSLAAGWTCYGAPPDGFGPRTRVS